jgi:CubicO group peptidase (beta-lactamase class C family)
MFQVFRTALVSIATLALIACGGSGGPGANPPPSKMDASQAADDLVSTSMHPAALTVQVTASNVDVQVRGLRKVGGAPATTEDRFPMGSLTKAMTATLAGVLVQDGVLDWNTKLLDVLPEFAASARAEYANVTLRDLLAHRAAIFPAETAEQIALLPDVSGTPTEQRLQLIDWALRRAPTFTPGSKAEYSNGGYLAAAAMIERAGALSYEQLLQARVFNPLGASVVFGSPGSTGGPLGHTSTDGKKWTAVPADDPRAQYPEFANPAGGALLRGADLGAFLSLHLRALRGENGLVITPATATTLHTVIGGDYALGWLDGKGIDNAPLSWHNGSDDLSYYSLMSVSSGKNVAAAAAVNGVSPGTEAALSAVVAKMQL